MLPTIPLTAAELETRIEELLIWALASHRPAGPLAVALAPFSRNEQDFVLGWIDAIAKTNAEMAFQFTNHAPLALRCMELTGIEQWLIRAMDVYDRMGMYPAYAFFRDVEQFAVEHRDQASGTNYDEVSGVLELFVRGLSGRPLKLEIGDEIFTDTASLFVPPRMARFHDREMNFRLYKVTVAYLWAQTRYGSFRGNVSETLAHYPDPARAQKIFQALEAIRLDACLARDLTGLHRDMVALRKELNETLCPPEWESRTTRLHEPEADVSDSLALLAELYTQDAPAPVCYQGVMHPDRAEMATAARVAQERDDFVQALLQFLREKDGTDSVAKAMEQPEDLRQRITLERCQDTGLGAGMSISITLDGKPLSPPLEMQRLMESILQDLGDIPDEYLTAAGDGHYKRRSDDRKDESSDLKTSHEGEGALLYHEWDYRRRNYRKDWCTLRETDAHPSPEPFAAETRRKHAGLIQNLRKSFEALRGDNKLLKKQADGDDVDFDTLVEAWTDMHTGHEMTDRLFTKRRKQERNIAVMFMVDMSGSTKGWINQAERESLVMLCEALEVLGDRYAIYGFSGMTRKHCELYRIKRFNELYGEEVERRIAGIEPKDYTRMGVTIRHLTKLLNNIEAHTKLLITLSDGKPDDYDGYRGDYGIEDTRQALIEAKRDGIHPFCITIDTEARDYLPHLYGAVNWTLVEDVKKLPLKVSEIYRRLTA